FALSPNPTNGQLQINVPNNLANSGLVEANSTIAIQVFDLYGRLLEQTTDEQLLQSGQSQMDVAALNTGIYFLQLQDESSGRLLGVERFVRE
ncbi:MAG: T9SS type A sorting domain-containing protein, partial [Chitinophagales bacterium]